MSILTVDDNLAHCYALSRILRESGFRVLEAHTGSSAIEIAESYLPEIVLLDIHLPDQTGYHVLRTLRQNQSTKDIGIIIHTATEPSVTAKSRAEQLGADGYLTYPIETPELLATVQHTLLQVRRRSKHRTVADSPETEMAQVSQSLETLREFLKSPSLSRELAMSITETVSEVEKDLAQFKAARKPN